MSSDNTSNQQNGENSNFEIVEDGTITVGSLTSYRIDFEKVNTLEDVINVLEAMDLHVYDNGEDRFEDIRHMLVKRESE